MDRPAPFVPPPIMEVANPHDLVASGREAGVRLQWGHATRSLASPGRARHWRGALASAQGEGRARTYAEEGWGKDEERVAPQKKGKKKEGEKGEVKRLTALSLGRESPDCFLSNAGAGGGANARTCGGRTGRAEASGRRVVLLS